MDALNTLTLTAKEAAFINKIQKEANFNADEQDIVYNSYTNVLQEKQTNRTYSTI